MSEKIYYQRNRETVVKRAKEYYENDIERLREQVKNTYRELSEEKNIKREYQKKIVSFSLVINKILF